jgi:hypothetical protein
VASVDAQDSYENRKVMLIGPARLLFGKIGQSPGAWVRISGAPLSPYANGRGPFTQWVSVRQVQSHIHAGSESHIHVPAKISHSFEAEASFDRRHLRRRRPPQRCKRHVRLVDQAERRQKIHLGLVVRGDGVCVVQARLIDRILCLEKVEE